MIGRIITVSSTRPIISAETARAAAPVALVAIGALIAGAAGLRDLQSAAAAALGRTYAEAAAAAPVGPERDLALDRAQGELTQALRARPDDVRLWLALSETRYLQATGAEVRQVSPALLGAARAAASEAIARAPENAEAHARLAAARSLLVGETQDAARALARSYALEPLSPPLAAVRAETAGRLWLQLAPAAREGARAEACMARREGAALAPVFEDISRDAACAPTAGPHNSPPSQP